MSKKVMMVIGIVTIFIIILLIVNNKYNKTQSDTEVKSNEQIEVSSIVEDEETGEYVVYNQETGEEIARSFDKASLHIYEIDPDYNPGIFDTEEIVEEQ